jgi:chaperonin GroES
MQGEVVAVGPGRVEKGVKIPVELKVGDRVLYGKYSCTEVEIDDETILITKESDVLAKLG